MSVRYTQRNIDWLGGTPPHWACEKIGTLFTERRRKVSDKEYKPLSVAKIGIVPQLETAVKTDAGDNRKLVCTGDFVINSRSDRKGSCGVSELDGSVSLINIVLTPRNQWNGRYVHYLMRSHPFSEEFYRNGRGIVADLWTTRFSEMKSILLPVPPRDEQDQIVRFLDWKVSGINKLINIKRKEIKDLESMKQAMVSSAVTRGLNQNAPMKFSGVKWLGDIPAHWALLRGKNLYVKMQRPVSETDEVVTCFRDGTVTLRKNRRTTGFTESLKEIGYQGIRKGDLVIHVMDAFAGSIGVSDSDGKGTPVYSVCQSIRDCNNHYYALLLREMARTGYIQSLYRGIRERSSDFRFEVFAAQFYPVPPREEQDQIVCFLDSRMSDFNRLISLRKQQIVELEDLKTRLISDVVTGKIDVRDVKIPEFNMVEEDIEDEVLEDNDETDANEEVE